jgi:hypothetical protein
VASAQVASAVKTWIGPLFPQQASGPGRGYSCRDYRARSVQRDSIDLSSSSRLCVLFFLAIYGAAGSSTSTKARAIQLAVVRPLKYIESERRLA